VRSRSRYTTTQSRSASRKGNGIPSTDPDARRRKPVDSSWTRPPFVKSRAAPRATPSVASVATKAGTRRNVMSTPLTRPTARPSASVPTTPSGMPVALIRAAPVQEVRAATAPTERSSPRITMASVIP
jgi:hypothetical protein